MPTYICQCGCGQPIPWRKNHLWKPPRYILGHAMRDPRIIAQKKEATAKRLERPSDAPVYVCQCGCGKEIPWRPNHRTQPPKYLRECYWRIGTAKRVDALRESKKRARMQPPEGWAPPSGLCECGCGKPTKIATYSRPEFGEYIGYPKRFVHGHNVRLFKPEETSRWQGGRILTGEGYINIKMPGHHLATKQGYVLEHRLVYEQSRGIRLPKNVVVHHLNGNKTDNRPENLIATTRRNHLEVHDKEQGFIAIFLDDLLLFAARDYVRQHGKLPDAAELTQQVYGQKSAPV